jgi:multidrug efflux pump subunit AcrB
MLDGLSLPNRAFFVAAMKPFDERKSPNLSVFAALRELNEDFRKIAAATVIPFNLPPIIGLSTSAGFEFQLVSRTGASPADLAATARGLVVAAQSEPMLAGVYTTYGASTPQIYLDLDRERAQILGVEISEVFNALQTAMGGYYANDFNLFGRTWQVKIQAEAADRRTARDIYRVRVRTSDGELIPLRAVAEIRLVTAPSTVIRYNNLRSVTINGGPAPGYSSGQAIQAMEALARRVLPAGFGYQWTGTAFQEKAASGQTGAILGLALVFAYLPPARSTPAAFGHRLRWRRQAAWSR